MKIIFILDYGSKYGFGHLARCSNLAENLEFKKIATGLITSKTILNNEQCKISAKFLRAFNSNIYNVNKLESKKKVLNQKNIQFINKIIENNIVIIDHYYLSKQFINELNNYRSIIQFKDDISENEILNPNYQNHKKIYFLPKSIVIEKYGKEKNIFSGLNLFPLFPRYLKLKKPKVFLKNNLNIFIVPGSNQTSLFKEILLKVSHFGNKNNFKIFTLIDVNNKLIKTTKVDGSNGLHNYIFYSDLVICAAGNVMLETLFLKSKSIVFCTNKNQISLINYLETKNKVFHLKNIEYLSEKTILDYAQDSQKLLSAKNEINFCCDKLIDIILNEEN